MTKIEQKTDFETMPNKHVIKDLYHAMNEKRLCIFVGAGVSKSSEADGIKFPSWKDLINLLQEDLELPEEQDYLKLAQLYYLQFGKFSYYKKLESFFNIEASPSLVHQLILKLKPQHIVTTNWDCLLERSISKSLDLYEVIASDEELSKSSTPNKLLKMHGDFEHNNIVFKEDDYLNYEVNFPLLSNYIKGILSTNTVLFVGYSYNDINLKLIMTWLKNHSQFRQPMYLLTFNESKTQIKYLENHGIQPVVVPKVERKYEQLDSYSCRVASFISDVLDYEKLKAENADDYILPVYNKLKHLSDYKYILYEQIVKSLGNCGYIHGESEVVLQFFKEVLTYDYDKKARLSYQEFIENLKSVKDGDSHRLDIDKLNTILSILSKASVSGILLSCDDAGTEYIKSNEIFCNAELEELLSFKLDHTPPNIDNIDDLMVCAHKLYLSEKYKESIHFFELALRLAILNKQYAKVLIASSNYHDLETIIERLNGNFDEKQNAKYKDFTSYYDSLPYQNKNECIPLYNTLKFSYFKERSFNVFKELKKAESHRDLIKSGGMSSGGDSIKIRNEHINMVRYFLVNNIAVQNFIEYKDVNKYYIEVSFNSQCKKEKIELVKEEIYALITCFKNKDLLELFNKFGVDDNKHYYDFIHVSEQNAKWLVTILLPNLVKYRELNCNSELNYGISSSFSCYIENTILISSFIKFDSDIFNNILQLIDSVINSLGVQIGFYETVNRFLAIQYQLFNSGFDKERFRGILESIVTKFANGKANGYEKLALQSSCITSFYGFAIEHEIKITNSKDIDLLIFKLKNTTFENQCQMVASLLISFYEVSNDKIKNIIDEYISDLGGTIKRSPTADGVILYLNLICNDFEPYEKDGLEVFTKFFENNNVNTLSIEQKVKIENLINYLALQKRLVDYKNVFENHIINTEQK